MKSRNLLLCLFNLSLWLLPLAFVGCGAKEPPPAPAEDCKMSDKTEIARLFERWNRSLQSGDPDKVIANYSENAVLVPTASSVPRTTQAQRREYFVELLTTKPSGRIDFRSIKTGCNLAVDTGLYTFTYAALGSQIQARYTFTYKWNGKEWLISSHHSSASPMK